MATWALEKMDYINNNDIPIDKTTHSFQLYECCSRDVYVLCKFLLKMPLSEEEYIRFDDFYKGSIININKFYGNIYEIRMNLESPLLTVIHCIHHVYGYEYPEPSSAVLPNVGPVANSKSWSEDYDRASREYIGYTTHLIFNILDGKTVTVSADVLAKLEYVLSPHMCEGDTPSFVGLQTNFNVDNRSIFETIKIQDGARLQQNQMDNYYTDDGSSFLLDNNKRHRDDTSYSAKRNKISKNDPMYIWEIDKYFQEISTESGPWWGSLMGRYTN